MLGWYDAIVSAVTEVTAGADVPARGREAFGTLRGAARSGDRRAAIPSPRCWQRRRIESGLSAEQVVSNAAVLLFGGIETTEGMIANALLHLLERPDALAAVRADPSRLDAAIEESLRLEPAAAVVDRYATADAELAGARIASRRARPRVDRRSQPRSGGVRRSRPARPRPLASPAAISRSPTARTCASACIWPGWRRAPASTRSCAGCRRCALDPGTTVPNPGTRVPQAADAVGAVGRRRHERHDLRIP